MKLLISLGKLPGENRVSAAYRWRSAVVKLTKKSQWNTDALFIHQIQTSDEWMQHLTAWVWVFSLLLRGSSTKYHITKNSVAMNADLFWTLNANKQGGGALTSRGWTLMGRWGKACRSETFGAGAVSLRRKKTKRGKKLWEAAPPPAAPSPKLHRNVLWATFQTGILRLVHTSAAITLNLIGWVHFRLELTGGGKKNSPISTSRELFQTVLVVLSFYFLHQ